MKSFCGTNDEGWIQWLGVRALWDWCMLEIAQMTFLLFSVQYSTREFIIDEKNTTLNDMVYLVQVVRKHHSYI